MACYENSATVTGAGPCPFCGAGENWVHWDEATGKYQVECVLCRARGPMEADTEIAVDSWNEAADGWTDLVGVKRELADLRRDLDLDQAGPLHYLGDGTVKCHRAIRSMCAAWDESSPKASAESFYWAASAVKYLWRFPLKGTPVPDLLKAKDCADRAVLAWCRDE